jgi:hypothetical protein
MENWQLVGLILAVIGVTFGVLNYTKKRPNGGTSAASDGIAIGGNVGNNSEVKINKNSGPTINGDYVAGDKFGGDKVGGDKVMGDKRVGG